MLRFLLMLSSTFMFMLSIPITANASWTRHNVETGFTHGFGVSAGDFNGDGQIDIVASDHAPEKYAWYESDGQAVPGFTRRMVAGPYGMGGFKEVYAVDLDNDGDSDFLSASDEWEDLTWWRNNGSGSFSRVTIDGNLIDVDNFDVGDVDNDGDNDIVAHGRNECVLYKQNSPGSFSRHQIFGGTPFYGKICLADFNDDNSLDLLVTDNPNNRIRLLINDGNENFSQATTIPVFGAASDIKAADIDEDGDLDVVASDFAGDFVAWWANNGSLNFSSKRDIAVGIDEPFRLLIIDIDGDSHLDVVAGSYSSDGVWWWKNDGNGNFSPTAGNEIDGDFAEARYLWAEDINGDGSKDVLCAGSHYVSWWENPYAPPIGLIAYYSFDDGTATDVVNEHNGLMFGTTVEPQGACGAALQFDGANDYIEIPDVSDFLFVDQSVTFSVWVKIADNSDRVALFMSLIDMGGDYRPRMQLLKRRSANLNGRINMQLQPTTVEYNALSIENGDELPKNSWMHVVGIIDMQSRRTKLYIDGQPQTESTNAFSGYDMTTASDLKLYFGLVPGVGNYTEVTLDEIRIYNYALSDDEVEVLYQECEEDETVTVSGIILEIDCERPLERFYATARLTGVANGLTYEADADQITGRFVIPSVPHGEYYLSSFASYFFEYTSNTTIVVDEMYLEIDQPIIMEPSVGPTFVPLPDMKSYEKNNVNYFFDKDNSTIDVDGLWAAITRAFLTWNHYSDNGSQYPQFSETQQENNSDIIIRFDEELTFWEDDECSPTTEPFTTQLAYTGCPKSKSRGWDEDGSCNRRDYIIFNSNSNIPWRSYPEEFQERFSGVPTPGINQSFIVTPNKVDIQTVALHEIGHILGLAHSAGHDEDNKQIMLDNQHSIMDLYEYIVANGVYQHFEFDTTIAHADLAGVRAFYDENALIVSAACPVDMRLILPDSSIVTKIDTGSIGMSHWRYLEINLDDDPELEDQIIGLNVPDGIYSIQIVPDAQCSDSVVYSLTVSRGRDFVVLADSAVLFAGDMHTLSYSIPYPTDVIILPTTWQTTWSADPRGTVRAIIHGLPEGYAPADIDPSTVLLNGEVPLVGNRLMIRPFFPDVEGPVGIGAFMRQAAVQSLGEEPEPGDYTCVITGDFTDGNKFVAECTITLTNALPKGGETEPELLIPDTYTISQNFPNPFNAVTVIEYALPQASHVTLNVFDLLGRRVATIVDGEKQAGYHQAKWNAGDQTSGMYFYRIKAEDFIETRKMLLLK